MTSREVRFAPNGVVLRDIRARVRELAQELGASLAVCDNLALIVDELVNNAIEHGAPYREHHHDLTVRIEIRGDHLVVEFLDPEMPAGEVADLARGIESSSNGMPALDSERGRGLFLLSIYLEGLRAEPASHGGLRLLGYLALK